MLLSLLRLCLYHYYSAGLPDYQEAYSPYPNAHLCMRYVIEVGKVIFMDDDLDLDPGEIKESADPEFEKSHFAHSAHGSR